MTSRERILCAMRGGIPDRVPVSPFGMGRISADTDLRKELIERTDILIDVWSGADPIAGSTAAWHREQRGNIYTSELDTPLGPLTRRVQRTPITSATIEFPLKTPKDVEKLLSVPYTPPEPYLDEYHIWRERVGDNGFVMVGLGNAVCLPAEWFSPEGFCLAWADVPELVEKLVAIASERINNYVDELGRRGVDGFRIVGGEYVSVQLGPTAFRRLVTPYDTSLANIIHSHNGIAYCHNHGKVTNYMKALSELGMDALDPLEAPPWGDVNLTNARKLAGDRLCFVGNLDDMEVVDSLPVEEVLDIARGRLREAGNKAFILGGTASGTYGEKGAKAFIAMAEMVARGDY